MRIAPSARPARASKRSPLAGIAAAWVAVTSPALAVHSAVGGEGPAKRYYAHEAVEDEHGVIAPWTPAQNGPCDFRVRVAAETMKRYPWAGADQTVMPAPHFVFNGHWQIDGGGRITISRPTNEWHNGDLGDRTATILNAAVDYYRYSGDPALVAFAGVAADYFLEYGLTPPDHPWPSFPVSCPTKGKHYGKSDPHGFIQLDIAAQVGLGLARLGQVTGQERWIDAARHWADLLAERCSHQPGSRPWPRYANPEDVPWGTRPNGNVMTGGVAHLLEFLEALIGMGYTGKDGALLKARNSGRRYLRDDLLPKWCENPTLGYNYWDWHSPVSNNNVVWAVARYLIEHRDCFPNWRTDARNVLLGMLNRTSVDPQGRGGVYSGAWAHPESSGCCQDSNSYGPQRLGGAYLQYAAVTRSAWAREIGRRQLLLATYDALETGVVIDGLLSHKPVVASGWFKIAHPIAMLGVLRSMGHAPDILGANRENHLMRCDSVVESIVYGKGRITYVTSSAAAPQVDVLRLAFEPTSVSADEQVLARREDLAQNGYNVQKLPGGDWIVSVRHDGFRRIAVEGDDPQQVADDRQLQSAGDWTVLDGRDDFGGQVRASDSEGASVEHVFTGNQVRLIGRVDPAGGKADVYLDGARQPAGVDCWFPRPRAQQVLYCQSGLKAGEHRLRIVVRAVANPLSKGRRVYVDAIQWSAAEGDAGFGAGGGPADSQRVIFGYPKQTDYIDSQGNAGRPAIEVVCRLGKNVDSVARAWWTAPRADKIENTPDPEIYRYGMHAPEFTAYFTVGPATYHVRVKLAETRQVEPEKRPLTIEINGREVVAAMDVAATAGGLNRAVDLVFNDIAPEHGTIAVCFKGSGDGNAAAQAVEIAPGNGGEGAMPVLLHRRANRAGGAGR